MILDTLPLTESERDCMRCNCDAAMDSIRKLSDESYDVLWNAILPEGLTDGTAVPGTHWSHTTQASGPSYPRPTVDLDRDESQKRELEWRASLRKFFERAFAFGEDDRIFIADYAKIFVTTWRTFLANPDAFCPWHDIAIVLRRDSHQFGCLVEDYHYVSRGVRPAIPSFDSKAFCRNSVG